MKQPSNEKMTFMGHSEEPLEMPVTDANSAISSTEKSRSLIGIAVVFVVIAIAIVISVNWLGPKSIEKVTGQILFDGKPLQDGFVMAYPEGGGAASLSELNSEGKYNLTTNGVQGAPTGRHRVVVQAFTKEMPPQPRIPVEFTTVAKTPLIIDVKPGGVNQFDFDLDQHRLAKKNNGETP